MNPAIDAPKRPALRYYGGKWKLAPWIISHFPEHKNYVEPCGGAASVLMQKPRSPLETYNDLDGNVVNFFRVLRDKPDELVRHVRLTPWARDEFDVCRYPDEDPLESARRFFVSSWMGISNQPHDKTTGMRTHAFSEQCYSLPVLNYVEMVNENTLLVVARRLMGVQIDNRDFTDVVLRFDRHDTLLYVDPPYTKDTRSSPNIYFHEWTDAHHVNAAELLRASNSYVVVSGYACPLYADLYERHGWQRFDTMAQTNSGGKRVESLWLSPRTVDALAMPTQAAMFVAA